MSADAASGTVVTYSEDEYGVKSHVRIWRASRRDRPGPLETREFRRVDLGVTGDLILTVDDGELSIWELGTQHQVAHWDLDRGIVRDVLLSPDTSRIAVLSERGAAQLYDADGKALPTAETGSPLTRLQFSEDGDVLIGWTEAGAVELWSTRTGRHLCRLVASDTGGSMLSLSGGSSGGRNLEVWNTTAADPEQAECTGEEERRVPVRAAGRRSKPEQPDFILAAPAGDADMLDPGGDANLAAFLRADSYAFRGAVVSPNAELAAGIYLSEDAGSTFRVVNTRSGESYDGRPFDDPIRSILSPNEVIQSAIFRPDGRALLTVAVAGEGILGTEFALRQWSLDGSEQISPEVIIPFSESEAQSYDIQVSYTPDQKVILAAYGHDVHVIDAESGVALMPRVRHSSEVVDARILDRAILVTTTEDGKVHVRDLDRHGAWPRKDWPLRVQVWTGTQLGSSTSLEFLAADDWWRLKRRHDELE